MRKATHYCLSVLLVLALASTAFGQWGTNQWTWQPNQNNNNNPRQPRPNNPQNPANVTQGTPRAPDPATQQAPDESLQTLPDVAGDPNQLQPPFVDDGAFRDIIQNNWPALVRINADKNRHAIGFIIRGKDDAHRFVVSNYLPLAGTNWIDIRSRDGSQLKLVGIYALDEQQDLVVFLAEAPENKRVKFLDLSDKDPKPGQAVYAVGMSEDEPGDWAGTGKVIKLEAGADVAAPYGSAWIRTDPLVSEGNRGGPLLNGEGKVVGIATSAGKLGRGPHLSCPVSKIREAMDDADGAAVKLPLPVPQGSFRWPEIKVKKPEVASLSKLQAAAFALKKMDCSKCNGFGYLLTPQFRTDPNTGVMTKLGDKVTTCTDCGGTGVSVKPAIYEISSLVAKGLLQHDPKIADADLDKIRTTAREGMDRVAVNRLSLAKAITPIASKILEDPEKNKDSAVTFLAVVGPTMRFNNRNFVWVKAYESDTWILTHGTDVRAARGGALPASITGNPMYQQQMQQQMMMLQQRRGQRGARWALVSGILQGYGVIESNKNIYRAPLLWAADIVLVRN